MAEKSEFSPLCILIWLALSYIYSIVLISVFSAELKQLDAVSTSQSKYDNDEIISFSDSLSTAYDLTNLKPIQEIYVVSPNSSCVDDELLNLKIWNSIPICSYPYSYNYTLGGCTGTTAENKRNNRYTIDSQRFFLTNWGSIQFCVKRFKTEGRETFSEYYFRNSFTCDTGYKACKNNICVRGENCPINNLLIIDASNQTIQLNTSEYNYSFIGNIQTNRQLYATRDYNSDFIIDLKIGINGKPCIHELETRKRTQVLSLLKDNPNDCSQYSSDENIYTQLDSQIEWDFYNQNNIGYVMQGLSLENFTSNDTAYLYSVVRTQNSCPSGNFLIDSDNSDISSFVSLRHGANIYGLIFLIIVLLLLALHTIDMICRKKELVDSPIISFVLLAFIFVEAIMCPISLNYLGKIVKNDKFLNQIITDQCFVESGYNLLFGDYGNDILIDSNQSYKFIHTILYFSLIIFILLILYFVDKMSTNIFFDKHKQGFWEEMDCCSDRDCDIDFDCLDCL